MKKILIVDDNPNNRMLLQVMLEDFAEDADNCEIALTEAVNGSEAVERATQEDFDLIFMDIMMPEMDGVEATRRIRDLGKNTMIVAVSAVDDAARQREILQNGAEDYISKPVNVDIFRSRIGNYFALIDSRSHPKHYEGAANLYTQEVFSRQLTFFVDTEDELSELWEYYLLEQEGKCEMLSDVVRTIYALGDVALKLSLKIRIVVEESDDRLYFTLTGIATVEPKLVKLVLAKNRAVTEYRIEGEKITFPIAKDVCFTMPYVSAPEPAAPISEPKQLEPETTYEPAPASIVKSSDAPVRIYNYMDSEDLEEITVYIGKLDSLFLVVGTGDLQVEEVEEIFTYIDRIGGMMRIYTESYTMGQALSELANTIASNKELFLEKSTMLAPMCSAFNRDLSQWVHLIFEAGASSVNYMDDSVIANAQTISSMLTMDDSAGGGDDLDDIFDF